MLTDLSNDREKVYFVLSSSSNPKCDKLTII